LADDDTPGIAPVMHALEQLPGYDWVVLLQPTSPLRLTEDIDDCLRICVERNAPACVTMTATVPAELTFRVDPDGTVAPILGWNHVAARRQDLPTAYVLNGAVYVARCDWLRSTRNFLGAETVASVMPPERSLDIDTLFDFNLFDAIKATKEGNPR
jgi:N-acylneuraminate cytidylyltransferase